MRRIREILTSRPSVLTGWVIAVIFSWAACILFIDAMYRIFKYLGLT